MTNKIKKNAISIHQPIASGHHEIAEGKYNTEQIWKAAQRKGLTCCRNNFWNLIKNPIYCGKIVVPAYKDEPMQWVCGQHQSIISETVLSHLILKLKLIVLSLT